MLTANICSRILKVGYSKMDGCICRVRHAASRPCRNSYGRNHELFYSGKDHLKSSSSFNGFLDFYTEGM